MSDHPSARRYVVQWKTLCQDKTEITHGLMCHDWPTACDAMLRVVGRRDVFGVGVYRA